MILIFINYSDVNMLIFLLGYHGMWRKAWLGQLIGQASSHANPAQALLPWSPFHDDHWSSSSVHTSDGPLDEEEGVSKPLGLWLFSPQPDSASKALKASIQASSSLALIPKPLLSQVPWHPRQTVSPRSPFGTSATPSEAQQTQMASQVVHLSTSCKLYLFHSSRGGSCGTW